MSWISVVAVTASLGLGRTTATRSQLRSTPQKLDSLPKDSPDFAWFLFFANGIIASNNKMLRSQYARAVRAGS